MRNSSLITFLLVTGLVVSCRSTDEETAHAPKPSAGVVEPQRAATETKEAVHAVQDYAYAQKSQMLSRLEEDLVELQRELDRLSAKAASVRGAARADAQTRLDAAREKLAETKKQLERGQDASEATWEDVKGGLNKSYGDLKDSFDKTRQWLSDKIKPA